MYITARLFERNFCLICYGMFQVFRIHSQAVARERMQATLGTALEKGTGVGLKICSDFIRLNKGTIWMKSKENAGSTFFISLPSATNVHAPDEKLVMI